MCPDPGHTQLHTWKQLRMCKQPQQQMQQQQWQWEECLGSRWNTWQELSVASQGRKWPFAGACG